jgi:hypothetical protein
MQMQKKLIYGTDLYVAFGGPQVVRGKQEE